MAATLEHVSGILERAGIKHKVVPEKQFIATGFVTDSYADPDGDKRLRIIIELDENGEYLKIFAPKCYVYKDGPHKEAFFKTCLMVSFATKLIQFEYDPDDGEVRAIIEFPLEDAILTDKQLTRCLQGLARIVDEYHTYMIGAMRDGIPMQSMAEQFRAFQEYQRSQRKPAPVDPGLSE